LSFHSFVVKKPFDLDINFALDDFSKLNTRKNVHCKLYGKKNQASKRPTQEKKFIGCVNGQGIDLLEHIENRYNQE